METLLLPIVTNSIYLHELFEKYNPKHLNQINKDFDEYPDNDGLKDIIGDKGMQNLNMNN